MERSDRRKKKGHVRRDQMGQTNFDFVWPFIEHIRSLFFFSSKTYIPCDGRGGPRILRTCFIEIRNACLLCSVRCAKRSMHLSEPSLARTINGRDFDQSKQTHGVLNPNNRDAHVGPSRLPCLGPGQSDFGSHQGPQVLGGRGPRSALETRRATRGSTMK